MTLYILLASSPLVLTLIINSYYKSSASTDRRARKALLVWFGILLFIMIAFRSRYLGSGDSLAYYNSWERIGALNFEDFRSFAIASRIENGFLFVVWLLSHILPIQQFMFITSGLFFTVAICRYVYKYSPNPMLSLIMFVTLGSYSFMVQGLRQAVAMCICLLSLEFCRQRKFFKFLLVIFIATLFHQTAIVFVLVYFLYGFVMDIKMYAVVASISILAVLFSKQIARWGNILFDSDFENTFEGGGYVAVAIYVIILVVAVVFAGHQRGSKDYTFFFLFTVAGFISYIMRYTGVQIAERISFYFMFGQMICLPRVLDNFDKKTRGIIDIVAVLLCIGLFMYRLRGSVLVPYQFFWQG